MGSYRLFEPSAVVKHRRPPVQTKGIEVGGLVPRGRRYRSRSARTTAHTCHTRLELRVYRVSSSSSSLVDTSLRAFSGRLKFTVRGHNLNKDSLSSSSGLRDHNLGFEVEGRGVREVLARASNQLKEEHTSAGWGLGFRVQG